MPGGPPPCKLFSPDGEGDADHAFASGALSDGGGPTKYVQAEARERDIPLLQFFTACIDGATPHSVAKARHRAALLEQHAGPNTLAYWFC